MDFNSLHWKILPLCTTAIEKKRNRKKIKQPYASIRDLLNISLILGFYLGNPIYIILYESINHFIFFFKYFTVE